MLAIVAAGALPACGAPRTPPTRVARQQPVQSGVADYDAFFRAVFELQLAVNESERARVETVTRLGVALGLGENADLEACAAAIRDRAQRLRRTGVRLVIAFDATAPAPPGSAPAPEVIGALPAPAPGHVLPTEAQTEASSQVDVRAETGSLPLEAVPLADAIRRAVRAALGLERRMQAVAAVAPSLRAAGERLAATVASRAQARASELSPEFRDALEFLDGAPARAQAQAQLAFHIVVRIQASASITGAAP